MSGLRESRHLKIPLKDIELATKNFQTCIGRGGYGPVYKGEISISGKLTTVAVKRLNEHLGQGLKEFLTEIQLLTGQNHPNLISLLGYCDEGKEIIVYEYAERGSLDRYLTSGNADYTLTWLERLRVCVDAARGLDHLHNHVGKHQAIIHRDIKSANILLDQNWVAKISDLGLSKLCFAGLDRSAVVSHPCGTHGYCEPEYADTGIVKKESDVYSFGMVLFEVLCGRLCSVRDKDGLLLSVRLAKDYYKKKKLTEIIDPGLREQMSLESMNKFSATAYGCVQEDRGHRPAMDVVVRELVGSLEIQVEYESAKPESSRVVEFDSEEMKLPQDSEDITKMLSAAAIYTSKEEPFLIDIKEKDQAATTTSAKSPEHSYYSQKSDVAVSRHDDQIALPLVASPNIFTGPIREGTKHSAAADWARVFEAAIQRRTEVLQPENLENMWTIGRNYKKKAQKNAQKNAGIDSGINKDKGKEISPKKLESSTSIGRTSGQIPPKPHLDAQRRGQLLDADQSKTSILDGGVEEKSVVAGGSKSSLRKSNSTSDLNIQTQIGTAYPDQVSGSIISEFYSANVGRHDLQNANAASDKVLRIEGYVPKLKCRVLGAYFEKLASKSFAVYSIAVTDAENNTWFVKRRYRNFERLHRQLKDIPNYTLHLPPKRIFSSSTEDAFVHQRCIQLDKYLQDLLSIANVAEQHEVWDFLSISSKSYSFGKSPSVMRTLAVNVDDAVDDIVRQFKGVSDGLMRKVVGPSFPYEQVSPATSRSLTWKADELSNSFTRQTTSESANSLSDNEDHDKDGTLDHDEMDSTAQPNGWHSDNELNSKGFPPRVVKHDELLRSLDLEKRASSGVRSEILNLAANFPSTSDRQEDLLGVPAEWTPSNVSVPLLNLVDKIFQLNRRGWLRRQVFWISKQILQLMMEDAIDDWLLRQIHWLRRDDIVAHGIRWIQDVLWPEGVFFTRLNTQNQTGSQSDQDSPQTTSRSSGSRVNKQGSFEEQLEAARRASDVKKMIFNGAPTTLVSLIGHNQYKRCAKDIYYFLQSDVCLKQLAYGLLELIVIAVFPELHDIITDVHEKQQFPPM